MPLVRLALLLASVASAGDYVVVVSEATKAEWSEVVQALQEKHGAEVVTWGKDVAEAREGLAAAAPRFACFVARPEEADRPLVVAVHRLTRALDDDPYSDCVWGILTGYDKDDALRIARRKEPLAVRRGLGGTGIPLEVFEEGAWFSEGEKNCSFVKEKGGEAKKVACPDDSTKSIVDELARGCDLFQTSGHATFRDWQIGYSYKNGQFRCHDGQLMGIDLAGKRYPIDSPSPKVYSALGNCLMGRIPDRDAMALAWMHTGGVHQMVGYAVSTWFGYGGWGVHDYFMSGKWTYAESFFLNQQALLARLEREFPGSDELAMEEYDIESDQGAIDRFVQKHGLSSQDQVGLLWDRDTVAFYGDPAWEARLARQGEVPWTMALEEKDGEFTFTVTCTGKGGWGRPVGMVLPRRLASVEKIEGEGVVTELFVLLAKTGDFAAGDAFTLRFRGK